MNRLRSGIEEWGMVTASVPAVFVPNHQFKLDQNPGDFPTIKDYISYQQGNVAGSSFQSTETGFSNQASIGLQPSIAKDPVTGVVGPVRSESKDINAQTATLPELNVNNFFGGQGTAPPGDLLGKLTRVNGISGRASILLGMNDKLTERILATMADPPAKDLANKNLIIHFAIVQVSCNPGWRTRENYIADLTATCEYYNTKSDLPADLGSEGAPRVFSVLPLLDAQNLELGISDRSVTALAAQVSAAYPTIGLNILGQDLITFVHRHQKDSATRTPVTVTNSYSNGRNFGFRFAPSFTAQADPAYRKSRAANILNPVSFPVLVTVVLDSKHMKEYDSVRVTVSNRWLIKDRPAMAVWYKRLYTPMERQTESVRINRSKDVDVLRGTFQRYDRLRDPSKLPPEYKDFRITEEYQQLRADALDLITKCAPQTTVIHLPEKPIVPPKMTCSRVISPAAVPEEGPVTLTLSGKNLGNVDKVVLGGKMASQVQVINGDMVLASFPAGRIGTEYGRASVVVADPVSVVILPSIPVLPAPLKTESVVTLGVSRNQQGQIIGISVNRGALGDISGKDLLDALSKGLDGNAKDEKPVTRTTSPSSATDRDATGVQLDELNGDLPELSVPALPGR